MADIPKYKKIDGSRWELEGTFGTKKEAQSFASKVRMHFKNARVVKDNVWCVYSQNKK